MKTNDLLMSVKQLTDEELMQNFCNKSKFSKDVADFIEEELVIRGYDPNKIKTFTDIEKLLPKTANSSINSIKFGALKTLSVIFLVFGWLTIFIGVVIACFLISEGNLEIYISVLICIGVAFVGLLTLAFGELIKLFLQIEENTHKK